MSVLLWVLLGLAGWMAVSFATGLVIGPALARAGRPLRVPAREKAVADGELPVLLERAA